MVTNSVNMYKIYNDTQHTLYNTISDKIHTPRQAHVHCKDSSPHIFNN